MSTSSLLDFLFLLFSVRSNDVLFCVFLARFFLGSYGNVAGPISLVFVFFGDVLRFNRVLLRLVCFYFRFLCFAPSSGRVTIISRNATNRKASQTWKFALYYSRSRAISMFFSCYGNVVGIVGCRRSSGGRFHSLLVLEDCKRRFTNGPCGTQLFRYFFQYGLASKACTTRKGGNYASVAVLFRGFSRNFNDLLVVYGGVLGTSAGDYLSDSLVVFICLSRVYSGALSSQGAFFLFRGSPSAISMSVVTLHSVSREVRPKYLSIVNYLFYFRLYILFLRLFLGLRRARVRVFAFLVNVFGLKYGLVVLFPNYDRGNLLLFLFALRSRGALTSLYLASFYLFRRYVGSLNFALSVNTTIRGFGGLVFSVLRFRDANFRVLLHYPWFLFFLEGFLASDLWLYVGVHFFFFGFLL